MHLARTYPYTSNLSVHCIALISLHGNLGLIPFHGLSVQLESLGVKALSLNTRLREMQNIFYGASIACDFSLGKSDAILASALYRNLYVHNCKASHLNQVRADARVCTARRVSGLSGRFQPNSSIQLPASLCPWAADQCPSYLVLIPWVTLTFLDRTPAYRLSHSLLPRVTGCLTAYFRVSAVALTSSPLGRGPQMVAYVRAELQALEAIPSDAFLTAQWDFGNPLRPNEVVK